MIGPAGIELHEQLPTAYGGCTCSCHTNMGCVHVMPCCYPAPGDTLAIRKIAGRAKRCPHGVHQDNTCLKCD